MNEWNHSNDPRYHPGYPPGYPQEPRTQAGRKSKWIAGLLSFFIPGTGYFYLGLMVKGIAIMLLIGLDICAIVFAAQQMNVNVLFIVLLSLLLPIMYFYSLFDAIQCTDTVNERRYNPAWPAPHYGITGGPVPRPMGPPPSAPRGYPSEPAPSADDPRIASHHAAGPAHQPVDQPDIPTGHPEGPAHPSHGVMDPSRGPGGAPLQISGTGMILLAAGAVVLLLAADIGWTHWLFQSSGSMVGAVVLIGAGIGLWVWEMRGRHGK
jgi:hypothetical protein